MLHFERAQRYAEFVTLFDMFAPTVLKLSFALQNPPLLYFEEYVVVRFGCLHSAIPGRHRYVFQQLGRTRGELEKHVDTTARS